MLAWWDGTTRGIGVLLRDEDKLLPKYLLELDQRDDLQNQF